MNGVEVELLLHELDVPFNIFDYFDGEGRLCGSVNFGEVVLSDFRQIDIFEKGVIDSCIFFDGFCFFMNRVGKFFLGWSSISRVELDSKVLGRSSWVVTGCEEDASKAVSDLKVELSNVS